MSPPLQAIVCYGQQVSEAHSPHIPVSRGTFPKQERKGPCLPCKAPRAIANDAALIRMQVLHRSMPLSSTASCVFWAATKQPVARLFSCLESYNNAGLG